MTSDGLPHQVREPVEGELDVLQLKRYIAYARAKCSPRLNEQVSATDCH